MNNKIFRELQTVPYAVNLMKLELVKSVNTCLVMSALEVCFEKRPNGFYKFRTPCIPQTLLEELSWIEITGLSENKFTAAFDNIGVRYNGRNEFQQAADKFQGKYYYSLRDPLNLNRTLFCRNHKLVDEALKFLVQEVKRSEVTRREERNMFVG